MTNDKDSAVLLPCPFCGCTNVYPVSPSLGHSSWRVFCDDCHAEGPQIPSYNSDEGEARCQWVWQIRYPAQSDALEDALSEQLTDTEIEDALVSEGITTWGPDGERFERMFAVVMKLRAALQEQSNG